MEFVRDILGDWPARLAADLGALPEAMQAWLVWLALVTLVLPLLMVRSAAARGLLMLTLPALALQALIHWRFGMTRLMAVPHLMFWFPALLGLIAQRETVRDAIEDGGPRRPLLRAWMALAAATLATSLVLDVRDALAWLYGADRPYGSRQFDLGPLIEAGERLVGERSGLEAPAGPEGAPAEPGGDGGAQAEDGEAEGR